MAFNPKIVFGLCNVLNRHAERIKLTTPSEDLSQNQIEQSAKRMDLIYRDSKTNWELICKNPKKLIENLISIQSLSSKLIVELYQVEDSIQKQLSKDLYKGGFIKFRTQIREQFDLLKAPIEDVKLLIEKGPNTIHPESIGAIESAIDVWKSCNKNKKIPKLLIRNNILTDFLNECFVVFGVKEDLVSAYKNWYKLTQKK